MSNTARKDYTRTPQVQYRLGKNIATLRRYWGKDQAWLAEQIGRDRHYIGRVERGVSKLDAEYLPAIATALQVYPEELVNENYGE